MTANRRSRSGAMVELHSNFTIEGSKGIVDSANSNQGGWQGAARILELAMTSRRRSAGSILGDYHDCHRSLPLVASRHKGSRRNVVSEISMTGLPWASNWGKYLAEIRTLTHTSGNPDWTSGSASELAARLARNPMGMPGMHAPGNAGNAASFYAGIDTIVAKVAPLHLAWPVLIAPPLVSGGLWTAKSDAQNRTLRSSVQLDSTGAIIRREDFSQEQWIDRWVETGVAAHEGQLFGIANQLLGLFTAICLIVLSISAFVLWWRRRPEKVLGAPLYPAPERPLAFSFQGGTTQFREHGTARSPSSYAAHTSVAYFSWPVRRFIISSMLLARKYPTMLP